MHATHNQKDRNSKMLTRQIAQLASSRTSSEEEYAVSIKDFEIIFSDKPVFTCPILSPRASSSCPEPIIYSQQKLGNPKDNKQINEAILTS